MSKFTTTNPNKSIYFIETNTYKQWFGAVKVLYCHKLKFLHIFFRQNKYLYLQLYHKNNNTYEFLI